MHIRHATAGDLDRLADIEALSYPKAEGASRACLQRRLAAFPDHFWLLEDEDGTIFSFVNGMATDEPDLTDAMYADPSLHSGTGAWEMLFSVVTAPERRGRGCAGALLREVLQDAERAGRRGVVLTCKEQLLGFYERYGFVSEGISRSEHGGAVWYQMRLIL